MIDDIIDAMKAEVLKYGLELMQRYPDDLAVHDRYLLEWSAKPGVKLAWVVGDSHTHMVTLGIHPEEQDMVGCFTRLGSNDRFYSLEINARGFQLHEMSREVFATLNRTRVPYRIEGRAEKCRLLCNDREVGAIEVTATGNYQERVYQVKIAAVAGASEKDIVALHVWASKCTTKMAGTLFCKAQFERLPDYQALQKAAA